MQAQRRGSTRFNSSPDELTEWDSHKMAPDSISRADVVSHDSAQSTRRGRYRTKSERQAAITTTATSSPGSALDDTVADTKTAKVPMYRVRGRSRTFKQDTEHEKTLIESTTAKANGESGNRPLRRKSYHSNKSRTITRNENQSIETNQSNNNKGAVSSTPHHATQTISSRKYQTDAESKKSTTELPSNHQPENHRKNYSDAPTTRKSPTGRRYRIRVVEANLINANAPTVEIEKKPTSSPVTDDAKTTAKKSDRETAVDEELNYPEHFKALLKSKKSTLSPNQVGSSRTNNFVPKKQIVSSTAAQTEQTTTIRPAYKHKKIERPNLKLLFPSLHTSSSTTIAANESSTAASTAIETDQTATDDLNTETNEPSNVSSTTAKVKTTVNKQVGGLKFSSKIRPDGEDSLPAFRSRSTPLNFDTQKSSTQYSIGKPDVLPPNHRISSVS